MPKVWNINDPNCPVNAINCMRPGPYGNPFIIGKHGDREKVCDLFECITLPALNVESLRGKDLMCCCKPARCHADSIFEKANSDAVD